MSSNPSPGSNRRPLLEAALREYEEQAGTKLVDNSALPGNSVTLDSKKVTSDVHETIEAIGYGANIVSVISSDMEQLTSKRMGLSTFLSP